MSTVEERMQNAIEELEQENRLLRARNDRLEAELKAVPVLSAGPITSEMANWSAEDKAELVAVIAKHTSQVLYATFPEGYALHELPADYTGKLWIEGQVRYLHQLTVAQPAPVQEPKIVEVWSEDD